jgi:hypothetical protein
MTPTHLSRLAAHLDVAPEVAAQALDELTASLREALRQQGTLTLQDVGTFWSEQGRLRFEPASSLVLAANGRYFGMEAFECPPPHTSPASIPTSPPDPAVALAEAPPVEDTPVPDYWQPPPSEESFSPLGPYTPPIPEEADFTLADASPAPEPAALDVSPEVPVGPEPVSDEFILATPAEPEALIPPDFVPATPEEVATALPDTLPQVWQDATPALPFPFDTTPSPEPATPPTPLPPVAPVRIPSSTARMQEGTSPAFMAGLVVLALLGGILFAYWWFNRTPTPASPTASLQTVPAPDSSADMQATGPGGSTDAVSTPAPAADPVTEPVAPATEAAPPPPATRLTGYAIIIGSEPTEALARTRASRYQNLGYPVEVLPGTANGQRRFRVGLGAFASSAEAESARQQLAGQIPGDAWVMVIR